MNQTQVKEPVVVIGGGLAAVSFVNALRSKGWSGAITVVSDEGEEPYDRPPLSKEFQREGNAEKIRLDTRAASDVEWIRNTGAQALDTVNRTVSLSDGRELHWGTLVLAMGASPRLLRSLDGAPMPVQTLRTLEDARRIREHLKAGVPLTVIGGGVIGLELAATAKMQGSSVTLIEALPRLLNRCAPSGLAAVVERRHRDEGVDIRLGRTATGFERDCLRLDDGSQVPSGLIVVGIGVQANDAIAREAGIAADDGIFVDGHGRTTCPGVLAIGDVTRQRNPLSGRFERIETWSNAQKQAVAAAAALMDPTSSPYDEVPWYWSDQYDMRLQVAGLAVGGEEILRGDVSDGKFSLLQIRTGRIVGAACCCNPREFMALKRLIAAGTKPDLDALRDPSVDVSKLGRAA